MRLNECWMMLKTISVRDSSEEFLDPHSKNRFGDLIEYFYATPRLFTVILIRCRRRRKVTALLTGSVDDVIEGRIRLFEKRNTTNSGSGRSVKYCVKLSPYLWLNLRPKVEQLGVLVHVSILVANNV